MIEISVYFEKPNPSQIRGWASPADPSKVPGLNLFKGGRFCGRYYNDGRMNRRHEGGLLFFICDITLVEVIYMHGLLHMTCSKELQKVSLELV